MKSYKQIKEMEDIYNEKYTRLDNDKEENKEDLIIFGHWVDFLSDLADWNVLDYAEKIGFDIEKEDDMFEYTEEVKKEIIITEEQAKEELKTRERICKKYPYGSCRNKWWINGINIDMLERDILKWVLEIE